jgi:hypothetical protein
LPPSSTTPPSYAPPPPQIYTSPYASGANADKSKTPQNNTYQPTYNSPYNSASNSPNQSAKPYNAAYNASSAPLQSSQAAAQPKPASQPAREKSASDASENKSRGFFNVQNSGIIIISLLFLALFFSLILSFSTFRFEVLSIKVSYSASGFTFIFAIFTGAKGVKFTARSGNSTSTGSLKSMINGGYFISMLISLAFIFVIVATIYLIVEFVIRIFKSKDEPEKLNLNTIQYFKGILLSVLCAYALLFILSLILNTVIAGKAADGARFFTYTFIPVILAAGAFAVAKIFLPKVSYDEIDDGVIAKAGGKIKRGYLWVVADKKRKTGAIAIIAGVLVIILLIIIISALVKPNVNGKWSRTYTLGIGVRETYEFSGNKFVFKLEYSYGGDYSEIETVSGTFKIKGGEIALNGDIRTASYSFEKKGSEIIIDGKTFKKETGAVPAVNTGGIYKPDVFNRKSGFAYGVACG